MKMKGVIKWAKLSVIITIFSLLPYLAAAVDTITATQPLTKNLTVVSSSQVFELGFFSPGTSKKWYIGIWYKKIPAKTVVWVANRDNPLSSSSGMLKIDKISNKLILIDNSGKIAWESNQTSSSSNTVAQILDTGNFVVKREKDVDPNNYLWQSFDHPSDTLLPGMKLGLDKKTGISRFLTSWKNKHDPSTGDYIFKLNGDGFPEFFIWQNQIEVYRSGPWNGFRFSGLPEMGSKSIMNSTFVRDEDMYSYKMTNSSEYSRLLVNSLGVLQRFVWVQTKQTWNVLWYAPNDQCDTYGECGPFGICDSFNSTLCQCMKGFGPKNEQEWNLRDGSGGCVRTVKLNCRNDGFMSLANLKLPLSSIAAVNESMSLADCRKACLRNCSCNAYASMDALTGKSGCAMWAGDLVDLRQYSEQKGGQKLFVRVPKKFSEGMTWIGRGLESFKKFLEAWDLRIVILFSLLLQIILIFLAPFRKRVSAAYLAFPMWIAYLLADITATYALGIIAKSQTHEATGPYADPNLLALWAPFVLVHLGGPDTVTALALEDNELWLRHGLNLIFHVAAVIYSFIRAFPNKSLWLPTLLMICAGLIKYTERTCSLYLASTRKFRSSLLTDPDPGPNYAKLMDEYASKIEAKLPTKIAMIPEPKRVKTTAIVVKKLSDLEIIQYAYDFFNKFKGLIADLIFSFRERTESRSFFLQRNARDAFKVVEVELNFIYDILYTKVVVVQRKLGYFLRFVSIILTCASLVMFIFFHKHKIEVFDRVVTYTLLIGAIALDAVALIMALTSDWTAVTLTRNNKYIGYLGKILYVHRVRWPDKKEDSRSVISKILGFVAKCTLIRKYRKTVSRRWSESISQYNVIHYCLNPRGKYWDKFFGLLGLRDMADGFKYVSKKKINDEIRNLIFEELKMKAEVADDLETSKEINSARGDWILRFHECYDLLPWVNDVDFDETLMLWHVATDLCYSSDEQEIEDNSKIQKDGEDCSKKNKIDDNSLKKEDGEDSSQKNKEHNSQRKTEGELRKLLNYRRFSKLLSDYMLYLLMMQSTLMSTVAGIGEIRFRDTCAEAKKFFEERAIKNEKGPNIFRKILGYIVKIPGYIVKIPGYIVKILGYIVKIPRYILSLFLKNEEENDEKPDKTHVKACKSLLAVHTPVKPVAVKGDRSKSVLFDACMLAKELQKTKNMWEIISKVWIELLCYAASRCRANRHAAQLSKGGEFITVVWLLMAHFGLGSQFQISEGHARAKLIVGK